MSILQRYISIKIISVTLLILLIFIGLQLLIGFVTELRDFGRGNYHFKQVLLYVLLDLPHSVYSLFPMIGLLGSVLGLGTLATHSELIVMRAAGVSVLQIAFAVIKAALVLVLIAIVIGEMLGPMAKYKAETYKALMMSGGQNNKILNGVWMRDGSYFTHIDTLVDDKSVIGITRYQFDTQHRLKLAQYAKRAHYDDQAKQWFLEEVTQSHISGTGVETEHLTILPWQTTFEPRMVDASTTLVTGMSLPKLYHYVEYRRHKGGNSDMYALSFWRRVFQPAMACLMIFLGIPFVFGSLRVVSIGVRLVMGILVGFGFYVVNGVFGPMTVVLQFPPFWAACAPLLVFLLIAFILMRRVG